MPEYAILLDNTDVAGAVEFAERARQNIKKIKSRGVNASVSVTASFGVYEASQGTIPTALKHADIALYRAKNNGRDQVATHV